MATIHFSSGKTKEIDSGKLDKFIIDLKGRGIKMMINRSETETLIVPLNSNTMEFIESPVLPVEEEAVEAGGIIRVDNVKETSLEDLRAELAEAKADVDSKKDIEEKEKEKMDEMMAKSNCKHPAEIMQIYRHDTKKGSRFFPVCGFCGKRERYVKAESLTEEVKGAAPIWED